MKYSRELDPPGLIHAICLKDNDGNEFDNLEGKIDTGSDALGIPGEFVKDHDLLTLIPGRKVRVTSPTGAKVRVQYFVRVKLPGLNMKWKLVRSVITSGRYFLIGRNILNDFRLTADGPNESFTLEG